MTAAAFPFASAGQDSPILERPGTHLSDAAALPSDHARDRPAGNQRRPYIHILLFLATFVTTTLAGSGHYHGFASDFGAQETELGLLLFSQGLWYSVTALAILGAHEFGHYLACRYYGVDASLPYFIPAPILLTGTLGAIIRIRQPIHTKPMLFDIGVAGPIAGFLVAVPALIIGIGLSRQVPLPADFSGLSLGEPLLFKLTSWIIWGTPPEGLSLNLHPMGFAAWFGLVLTALNLFPIGQLDGGHIAYAAFGRRSVFITFGTLGIAVLLTFWSHSWVLWTLMLIVMLAIFGARHPRTVDEHIPLDRRRRLVAIAALIMLILCFTPNPIEPLNLLQSP